MTADDETKKPRLNGSQVDAYRAALDRLFQKDETKPKARAKIVGTPPAPGPEANPAATDRDKLVAALYAAEGRQAITKAVKAFGRKNVPLPEDEDAQLQLLEHLDESVVRSAIEKLGTLFARHAPKRKELTVARLRRLEEFAEEAATREAAEALRSTLSAVR